MMAVWEVGPPVSVRMASTFSRSMVAVSEGRRSCATTMTGSGSAERLHSGRPASKRRRRSFTSSRSAVRSRIRGSAVLESRRIKRSKVEEIAQESVAFSSVIAASSSSRRASSSRISMCARKTFAFSASRSCIRRWISRSSCSAAARSAFSRSRAPGISSSDI